MRELLLSLLPAVIALAIVPGRFMAVLLLFHTRQAALTALSFVGGMAGALLIQGATFTLIFSVTGLFSSSQTEESHLVLSILFLVVGILMLVGALRQLLIGEDGNIPLPKWLNEIESFTPGKAFVLGLVWLLVNPSQWIFVMTATAMIFDAGLSPMGSLVIYLLFILIVLSLFLLLVAIYVIFPERSRRSLDRLFKWLRKNWSTVLVGMLVLFGLFFFMKGFQGLLA